jgi:hypothetical protein
MQHLRLWKSRDDIEILMRECLEGQLEHDVAQPDRLGTSSWLYWGLLQSIHLPLIHRLEKAYATKCDIQKRNEIHTITSKAPRP